MAEGNRDNENNFTFRNYSLEKEQNDSDDSDGTEESYVKPDLGIGNEPSFEKKTDNFAAANDLPKREDNPFSFKHFLRRETGNTTYHNTGARPKVYSNSSSDSYSHLNTPDSDPGLYSPSPRSATTPRQAGTPELTSVLPDFVQDHLVIEQSYLNHSDSPTSPHMCVNLDNLPDFALNSSFDNSGRSRLWDEPRSTVSQGLSCDDHSPGSHSGRSEINPLDLPNPSNLPSFPVSPNRSRVSGLPFDLPLVGELDAQSGSRVQQLADVGVSKSLPDFLSDGPIHSSLLNDASQPCIESPDNTTNNGVGIHDADHQRILNENERLKRDVEASRRQMMDKTRRIQALEKELQSMRVKDQVEMATLEKAMEQVEDNLKRSTRRAVTAENTVSKLKQEMKSLMSELTSLRQANRAYRHSEAGASTSHSYPLDDAQSRRIAGDLRLAASTAEQSLRTLLTGVSNLRDIASTIESINRIQDRTGDYEKDPDDDTGGSAL